MSDVQFDFSELEKWKKRVVHAAKIVYPQKSRQVLRNGANLLRRETRKNAPQNPDKTKSKGLKRSFRTRVRSAEEAEVYSRKFFAIMVEEGHKTRGKEGQKSTGTKIVKGVFFMKKAVETIRPELDQMYMDFVKEMGKEMGLDVS